ncbi:MAG: c-type cytochrome [Acidobacteriaceae bacterium]|nr:c-type cytochrome [Acidobacteriaceae bacterium]
MFIRCLGLGAAFLTVVSLNARQADQAASAEKQRTAAQQEKDPTQKHKTDTAVADLLGGPKLDPAAVERGRKVFVPTCGFCHGNDAHGKSGPDLVRSALVLHDKGGDTIGPIIRNGRPDRGMPAFSSLTSEQIADISTFLHSRAGDVSNRFAYKIGNIITGNPQKGSAFFNGAGHCDSCHSPTGDLAHIAGKYDAVELQRRMLYPVPNVIDALMGKAVKPSAPTNVTVTLASGNKVSGTLDHLDEFNVSLHDSEGWYHSYPRDQVQVDVKDPRAAHEALLPKYTDEDMHNVLAYLETLK